TPTLLSLTQGARGEQIIAGSSLAYKPGFHREAIERHRNQQRHQNLGMSNQIRIMGFEGQIAQYGCEGHPGDLRELEPSVAAGAVERFPQSPLRPPKGHGVTTLRTARPDHHAGSARASPSPISPAVPMAPSTRPVRIIHQNRRIPGSARMVVRI